MPEMRVPFGALARRYKLHGFDPIEVGGPVTLCVPLVRNACSPGTSQTHGSGTLHVYPLPHP